ncbi:T9SS C-terminal target domain-containing protein [Fibrisoma montanum]|uniref:T9SS C-terminal target domain-containing protein n=1 Tax=Fibrisoma montanum TaxID=2305895 RepID=A0A418MJU7_9BACT|nr:3-coathanger stack domain-containing protein [Fibrisoma montanum]RIV27768.1 T9SS C-terminal target domain-containing protein [Fibrisoma montanum]
MKNLIMLVLAGLISAIAQAQDIPSQQTIRQAETAGSVRNRMAIEQISAYNTVERRAKTRYTAGRAVTLQPGFMAQAGSVFTASIGQTLANATQPEIEFSARAYPNPFQQTTTIEYTLPQAGQVSFTLVDEQGHIVQQETSSQEAGRQKLNLTSTNLTQGIYFYQIRLNNHEQRTIRLLKTQ